MTTPQGAFATLSAFAEPLLREPACILSTHVSPDADAIGSCFGMAHLLRHIGSDVFVWLQDPLPEKFAAWTEGVPWSTTVPERRFSAAVFLDTASRPRVGREVEQVIAQADRSYNVDHHISNTLWADQNFVDADAPSCSVIVWRMLNLAKVPPATIANGRCLQLLYGGLVDDTGRFCFPNATPEAFAVAAEMVAAGARPDDAAERLYFSQPLRMLQLQGLALGQLRSFAGGAGTVIVLNADQFAAAGATSEDAEGIVELARSVEGTEVAVFLRQLDVGWKASLRAKVGWLDVNAIAGEFGGGGHRAAAGCRVLGSQREATDQLLRAVEAALQKHRPGGSHGSSQ